MERKQNPWVQHIREYAAHHKITYREALSPAHIEDVKSSYAHRKIHGGSIASAFKNMKKKVTSKVNDVKEKFEEVGDAFRGTNYKLSPAFEDMLKRFGNQPITWLQVVRTPLNPMLRGAMDNAFGLSQSIKAKSYDELYHLSLRITLQSGATVITEKAGPPQLHMNNTVTKTSEVYDVPLNGRSIPLRQFIVNGINFMGENKFYTYDATRNNCQDYILGLLGGSGFGDEESRDFIKQDVSGLFSRSQRGFMKGTTELNNRAVGVWNAIRR